MGISENRVSFTWALCSKEGEAEESLLLNPNNLTYSAHEPTLLSSEDSAQIGIGGYQENIILSPGQFGVLQNHPCKELFLGTEQIDLEGTPIFDIRIEYDIVTLSTSEQADLYQRNLCG
jgi:hypothetical protein